MPIARSVPTPTSHRVVVHRGVLYLGGLGAPDTSQDMYGQAKQVFERVDGFLTGAGSDRGLMLRATLFISDYALQREMDRAWNEWLQGVDAPARSTIVVGDMGDGLLIEAEITAAVGHDDED